MVLGCSEQIYLLFVASAGVSGHQTQFRPVLGNRVLRTDNNQSKPTTITFNPRTQLLTTNLRGGAVQQPVQIVQVGGVSHMLLSVLPTCSRVVLTKQWDFTCCIPGSLDFYAMLQSPCFSEIVSPTFYQRNSLRFLFLY